jgi:hypothetical protein
MRARFAAPDWFAGEYSASGLNEGRNREGETFCGVRGRLQRNAVRDIPEWAQSSAGLVMFSYFANLNARVALPSAIILRHFFYWTPVLKQTP